MDRWLDYSAARLSGQTIKAAGFQGAIRYVGTRGRGKNATASEVNSIRAAGLGIHGVYENSTRDWATGFSGGVAAARAALADPATKAMPSNAVIFVCADMHLSGSQPSQFRQYVLGAQSVLGKRCGAYGFSEAIDAVRDLDIWFWQCGSQSVVRSVTHVYQWNNGTARVGGITCDINYIYRPLTGPLSASLAEVIPPFTGDDEMILACQGFDPKAPKAVLYALYSGGVLTGLNAEDAASVLKSYYKDKVVWVTAERMRELAGKSAKVVG